MLQAWQLPPREVEHVAPHTLIIRLQTLLGGRLGAGVGTTRWVHVQETGFTGRVLTAATRGVTGILQPAQERLFEQKTLWDQFFLFFIEVSENSGVGK